MLQNFKKSNRAFVSLGIILKTVGDIVHVAVPVDKLKFHLENNSGINHMLHQNLGSTLQQSLYLWVVAFKNVHVLVPKSVKKCPHCHGYLSPADWLFRVF